MEESKRKPEDLKPLTDKEVEAIIGSEISDSVNYFESEVTSDQEKALRYYFGEPFGNEVKGRSQVQLTDVRDTVEMVMPSLMKMFFGARNIVSYKPRGEDDIEWARQATDYARYCTKSGSSGFTAIYDWFKDALIQKVGAILVTYDDRERRELERYANLSQEQFDALIEDDDVELVSYEETKVMRPPPPEEEEEELPIEEMPDLAAAPGGAAPVVNPMSGTAVPPLLDEEELEVEEGEAEPIEVSEYEVHIRRKKTRGQIKFEGIPPEEFLIAGRARRLNEDDCPFVGRRVRRTHSDLVAMGFEPAFIHALPHGDGPIDENERRSDEPFSEEDVNRPDWASREIWLTECWIRVDRDGDGYAELRRILCAGDTKVKILEDDETSFIPIAAICPIPIPHKFHGMSLADLIMDLQLIRSTLLRQYFDNIYNTTNIRFEVVNGEVEIDDLLSSSPGGVVRVNQPGMVNPLQSEQLGPGAWHLLEYLHQVKDNRTGLATAAPAMMTGETATGFSGLQEQANLRIEQIARIFGETGVKRLYEQFLNVMREADVKDQVIRLRDEWVEISGDTWKADLDVEVEVGLGTQQSAIRTDNLLMLFDLQKQVMDFDGRMVTPSNVYNVLQRVPEAMGFSIESLFFTEPDPNEDPPEPDPDPKVLEIEMKKQAEMVKLQIERETLQFRREAAMIEAQLKREQMQTQIQVAQIQAQGSIAQAQVHADGNVASATSKQEADLAVAVMRQDSEVRRQESDLAKNLVGKPPTQ